MVAKPYTFQESVEYLLSLGNEVSAMKLGLDSIKTLLTELGRPSTNILKVQVAGTNGKGSVCAFLNSICLEAGIKTGLYTSPHLVSITERIKINGVDIAEDEFARIASIVRDTSELLVEKGQLESVPTFFEQVTAIALIAFANHSVELIILETGLGGRLDATTAANAEIAAITRIDYDHQQYLGETIEEIAAEKAAIIRDGSKVVIGAQSSKPLQVLLSRCKDLGIVPQAANKRYIFELTKSSREQKVYELDAEPPTDFGGIAGLAGRHQIENAHTAVMISGVLANDFNVEISENEIRRGIEKARHPGRLESIGKILLDGAHNSGGAMALREFLDEFVRQPIVMIFGAMADKSVDEIAQILFPKANRLILTKAANSRAIEPAELVKFIPSGYDPARVVLADTAESALNEARILAGRDKLVLVTGSLYVVGEVRAAIMKKQQE